MSDDEVLQQLVNGVEGEVEQVLGNRTYDRSKYYDVVSK